MMAKTKLKNCERGGQSVIFDLTNDLLGRLRRLLQLCWRMLAPPQSLHLLLMRLC